MLLLTYYVIQIILKSQIKNGGKKMETKKITKRPVFDWVNFQREEGDPDKKSVIRQWLANFWDKNKYKMCEEWKTCSIFIFWAEKRVKSEYYTIFRGDKSRKYSPDNIQFTKDLRTTLRSIGDYEYTIQDISEMFRIPYNSTRKILLDGISVDNLTDEYNRRKKFNYSKKQVSINISEETHKKGKVLSMERGVSFSGLVEQLIYKENEL